MCESYWSASLPQRLFLPLPGLSSVLAPITFFISFRVFTSFWTSLHSHIWDCEGFLSLFVQVFFVSNRKLFSLCRRYYFQDFLWRISFSIKGSGLVPVLASSFLVLNLKWAEAFADTLLISWHFLKSVKLVYPFCDFCPLCPASLQPVLYM